MDTTRASSGSSFSRVRFKPGGPPPVFSRSHLLGLPSNTPNQQAECDRGTAMCTSSVEIARAIEEAAVRPGQADNGLPLSRTRMTRLKIPTLLRGCCLSFTSPWNVRSATLRGGEVQHVHPGAAVVEAGSDT